MKYRVSESAYLALSAARIAVAHGQPVMADDVRKLLSIIDSAVGATQSRADLLGQWCGFASTVVESGRWEDLDDPVRNLMTTLHQRSIPLTVDDLGLTREQWGSDS